MTKKQRDEKRKWLERVATSDDNKTLIFTVGEAKWLLDAADEAERLREQNEVLRQDISYLRPDRG